MTRQTLIVAFLLVAFCGRESSAQNVLPAALRNVGIDQQLGAQVPLDLEFVDEDAKPVHLRDYFGDKPVILVLAYYRCPMLCTQVLNGLVEGLREMPLTVGKEFRVLTVSFDPDETPQMAAAKRQTYLRAYGLPEAATGWHFLTGQQQAISELTHAVGFRYAFDAASGQFAHAAGIVVLAPSGTISRYFFDIHYSGRDLEFAVNQAAQSRVSSPIAQILLFCFHYDPTAGRYGSTIMQLVRLGGLLTVVGLCAMFGWLLRSERNRRTVHPLTTARIKPNLFDPNSE